MRLDILENTWYIGKDSILSSSDSRKWFLLPCRSKYERLLWYKSSLLLSRYTRGRNQTPFSRFIVAISFLSEESYSSFFVLRSSSCKEREKLTVNHTFIFFIVVQKCAPYANKVRARRTVGLHHELQRRRCQAFIAFSQWKIHLHWVRCGDFRSFLFFLIFRKNVNMASLDLMDGWSKLCCKDPTMCIELRKIWRKIREL